MATEASGIFLALVWHGLFVNVRASTLRLLSGTYVFCAETFMLARPDVVERTFSGMLPFYIVMTNIYVIAIAYVHISK